MDFKKILRYDSGFTVGNIRSHKRFCKAVATVSSFAMLTAASAPAFAGTAVLGGDATLTAATGANLAQNTDAYAQFVSSGGASAVLDWSKFDIGAGKEMNFSGAGTTFFNLVDAAASKSQIDGIISGNGSVWVVNPNGIAFGANSQVNIGGIFAAAAGNISNADALRSGTATMPEFSSFEGNIDVGELKGDESAKFAAERVLLLANHVSVNNADASESQRLSVFGVKSAQLGKIPIDEVNGGMITVNFTDFRYDQDTGVELGDLISLGYVGVVGSGRIDVSGNVIVENGSLALQSLNGDVTVGKEATLEVKAPGTSILLSSACLNSTYQNPDDGLYYIAFADDGSRAVKGNVNVHGRILANADGASVGIHSAAGYYTGGSVNMDGSIENVAGVENGKAGGVSLDVGNWYDAGDGMSIGGTIESDGDVMVAIYRGGFDFSGSACGDMVNIETVNGDLIVGGDDSGGTSIEGRSVVRLGTYSGDIIVNESADVSVRADGGRIEGYSAEAEGGVGSIHIDGNLNLSGNDGLIQLKSGRGAGSEGSIVIGESGVVSTRGDASDVYLYSGYEDNTCGEVLVKGNVEAAGKDGFVGIYGGFGDNAVGNVLISGDIHVEGEGARAEILTGFGNGAQGNLAVATDGKVSISGEGSYLALVTAQGDGSQGDLTLNGNVEANGKGVALNLESAKGANAKGNLLLSGGVVANGDDARIDVASGVGNGAEGNVDISGDVALTGDHGIVSIGSGVGSRSKGSIYLSGTVAIAGDTSQLQVAASVGDSAQGSISASGAIKIDGDGGAATLIAGYGADACGAVDVNGSVVAKGDGSDAAIIGGYGERAVGSVKMGGEMRAGNDAQIRVSGGNVSISGTVSAGNDASVVVSGGKSLAGNLVLCGKGCVNAGSVANVLIDGNVSQEGNKIVTNNGAVEAQSVSAAITADTINLKAGGSIGCDAGYVGVDGKVRAIVGGDAYLAAANGTNFRGGDSAGAPSPATVSSFERTVGSIDENGIVKSDRVVVPGINEKFDALAGASAIVTGGNLSIYTARKLEANGLLKAERNITVSASDFGDVSYLQAGGTLTINNVGKQSSPKIAYFESVNGIEPKINNQPNDTVIFVDGRLAGGNLKILNQFGADEAFMVSTPELKSTQGIFGSPTFLHSDLDVANPMEVGSIDYMLQETPRLTLDKDFPKEADQHVDSVVIPERDSIQFGRSEKNKTAAAAESKVTML